VNSVPQGSKLGPLLFSAFIDNILALIDIPFLLYAVDRVIYFQNGNLDFITQVLNRNQQKIQEWAQSNAMRVNTKKNGIRVVSQVS